MVSNLISFVHTPPPILNSDLEMPHGTHNNCLGALCFCCGAPCKVQCSNVYFPQRGAPYHINIAVPLQEQSSRPVNSWIWKDIFIFLIRVSDGPPHSSSQDSCQPPQTSRSSAHPLLHSSLRQIPQRRLEIPRTPNLFFRSPTEEYSGPWEVRPSAGNA